MADSPTKLDLLKKLGITDFEYRKCAEATDFPMNTFCNLAFSASKHKQTDYLIENDTMSDEEWDLYFELRWPDFKKDDN